jgi:hypothetical protein
MEFAKGSMRGVRYKEKGARNKAVKRPLFYLDLATFSFCLFRLRRFSFLRWRFVLHGAIDSLRYMDLKTARPDQINAVKIGKNLLPFGEGFRKTMNRLERTQVGMVGLALVGADNDFRVPFGTDSGYSDSGVIFLRGFFSTASCHSAASSFWRKVTQRKINRSTFFPKSPARRFPCKSKTAESPLRRTWIWGCL